jgi:hypothetical protein
MIDLLITGTGRCGTQFMAEWLTRSGVPCGHEAVFSYRGYTSQPDLVADSSWLAVPYLGLVTCRIVHIVRNPLDVVRSFMGTRHFGPESVLFFLYIAQLSPSRKSVSVSVQLHRTDFYIPFNIR